MKVTDKNKTIRTIPDGAWESGISIDKKDCADRRHLNDITTDIQGNGYPIIQDNQDD